MATRSRLTWLYVPGNRRDRLSKAYASGADVMIIDLEDAVAADDKDSAREEATTFLTQLKVSDSPGAEIQVRVNSLASSTGKRDLQALSRIQGLSGIRLPKVESATTISHARDLLSDPTVELHCLIESALGVENMSSILATGEVSGISLGEADLLQELRLSGEAELSWIRSRLVIAAASAGLPAPVMSAYTHVKDLDGLAASCRTGRRQGFLGRTAIHPRQLAVIAASFVPSSEEVEKARRVVTAYNERPRASFSLNDGTFVDRPILEAARQTLSLARQI